MAATMTATTGGEGRRSVRQPAAAAAASSSLATATTTKLFLLLLVLLSPSSTTFYGDDKTLRSTQTSTLVGGTRLRHHDSNDRHRHQRDEEDESDKDGIRRIGRILFGGSGSGLGRRGSGGNKGGRRDGILLPVPSTLYAYFDKDGSSSSSSDSTDGVSSTTARDGAAEATTKTKKNTPPTTTLAYVGKGLDNLGKCEGDCGDDSQCLDDLKCYQRRGVGVHDISSSSGSRDYYNSEEGSVPGCAGRPMRRVGYCYDENDKDQVVGAGGIDSRDEHSLTEKESSATLPLLNHLRHSEHSEDDSTAARRPSFSTPQSSPSTTSTFLHLRHAEAEAAKVAAAIGDSSTFATTTSNLKDKNNYYHSASRNVPAVPETDSSSQQHKMPVHRLQPQSNSSRFQGQSGRRQSLYYVNEGGDSAGAVSPTFQDKQEQKEHGRRLAVLEILGGNPTGLLECQG